VALVALTVGCGAATAPPASFSAALPAYHDGARLAVVGDLQRTAPLLEVWREQNDAERARVVAAIADVRPDLLVITGDSVFDGGSDSQWEAFDRLTSPLRDAAIPTVLAFGNHEHWRGRMSADAHAFPRFPLDANRHWFTVAFGPLRLVVLDSNDGSLGPDAWASQVRWYGRELEELDADVAVRGVLVAFHHPPFTNSTVTGDATLVQRVLVPPFARSKKTLAMLNGHTHSYERFVHDGKTYVVSGGGGGPRAAVDVTPGRRHPEDQYAGPSVRDFGFTVYTVGERGVTAEVRGLAKGGTEWRTLDTFELPWPL
jgi:3',5'-cyclic AMP phosphodiesterase CpdA